MQFNEVLQRLANSPVELDFSTGSPLVFPEIQEFIRTGVRELADDARGDEVLSAYTQLDGLNSFREEIADLMSTRYGRPVSTSEVIAVPGVQVALHYLHAWLSARKQRALYPIGLEFPGAVDRTARKPPAVGSYRSAEGQQGIWSAVLNPAELQDWTDVGAVILSRPHSPTGRDWNPEELSSLAETAARHEAVLVLDETYAPPFAPITLIDQPLVDAPNVVRLFSMSKLGLAGERVGVIVAKPELVRELIGLQRSFIIQPPKMGQYLTSYLIKGFYQHPELREKIVKSYQDRWQAGFTAIKEIGYPGIRVSGWEGGLFLWLEWDHGASDLEVTETLLGEGIAVMPGAALFISPDSNNYPRAIRIGLGGTPAQISTVASAVAKAISRRF